MTQPTTEPQAIIDGSRALCPDCGEESLSYSHSVRFYGLVRPAEDGKSLECHACEPDYSTCDDWRLYCTKCEIDLKNDGIDIV